MVTQDAKLQQFLTPLLKQVECKYNSGILENVQFYEISGDFAGYLEQNWIFLNVPSFESFNFLSNKLSKLHWKSLCSYRFGHCLKRRSLIIFLKDSFSVWLYKKKLKRLVVVISEIKTKEVVERWQFDIETENVDEEGLVFSAFEKNKTPN